MEHCYEWLHYEFVVLVLNSMLKNNIIFSAYVKSRFYTLCSPLSHPGSLHLKSVTLSWTLLEDRKK